MLENVELTPGQAEDEEKERNKVVDVSDILETLPTQPIEPETDVIEDRQV